MLMTTIVLTLCAVITVATIAIIIDGIRNKKSIDNIIFYLAVSSTVQLFVISLGIELHKDYSIISLFNALTTTKKSMGGEIAAHYVNEDLTPLLIGWLYALWFIAPIATGGILVSSISKINMLFRQKIIRAKSVHIFTELTPRTVLIGRSIYNRSEEKRKIVIVYLSSQSPKELDIEIPFPTKIVNKSINNLQMKNTTRSVEIWDFSFDRKIRTTEIIEFIKKFIPTAPNSRITLRTFGADETSLLRYDKINHDDRYKNNIEIWNMDIHKQLSYSVINDLPFYSYCDDNDTEFNVLLIGCGKTGCAFIEKIAGYGHFLNKNKQYVKVRATIFDIHASDIRNHLMKTCPDFVITLEKEQRLEFFDCDVDMGNFAAKLDTIPKIDYCIISTNDDERNIRTAKYLYTIITRKLIRSGICPGTETDVPPIIARIRDEKKAEFFRTQDSYIHPFGSDEELFCYDKLSLESYAGSLGILYSINNHNYPSDFDLSSNNLYSVFADESSLSPHEMEDIIRTMEEALFLKYVAYSSSHPKFEEMFRNAPSSQDSCRDYYDKNTDELYKLVSLLHNRWRDYTLFNGYSCPSEEDHQIYAKYNKSIGKATHKYDAAKYNSMLVSADKLEKYTSCDIVKVKMLPYIINSK